MEHIIADVEARDVENGRHHAPKQVGYGLPVDIFLVFFQ
jgi:hypothetical protein